jgi:hypothetical protein
VDTGDNVAVLVGPAGLVQGDAHGDQVVAVDVGELVGVVVADLDAVAVTGVGDGLAGEQEAWFVELDTTTSAVGKLCA